MMTLLGQHGQIQDFYRGVELIRFSADVADEYSPQGAYVRISIAIENIETDQVCRSTACFKPENYPK